jgi:hypothetical protein
LAEASAATVEREAEAVEGALKDRGAVWGGGSTHVVNGSSRKNSLSGENALAKSGGRTG